MTKYFTKFFQSTEFRSGGTANLSAEAILHLWMYAWIHILNKGPEGADSDPVYLYLRSHEVFYRGMRTAELQQLFYASSNSPQSRRRRRTSC
jgi:hypothetical protein